MDYSSSSLALTSALLLASGDAESLSHAGRIAVDGLAQDCASLGVSCGGMPALELLERRELAPANGGMFDLLTYNVAGLPDAISPSHPATNTPLISPLLNHYDLALVQEDFYYHAELIGGTRHPYRSEEDGMGFALPGDGLAVLSKFALGRTHRVRWTDCNGYVLDASDCLADKGFSFGEVALAAGVIVDAYNVHADAGRSVADEWVRRSNFEQLASFMNARPNGRAVIVAGDTNLHVSSAEDARTLARFLKATGLEDACGDQHKEHQDGIDRVLFRVSPHTELSVTDCWRDPRFVDAGGRGLSDHPAIGVQFRWRRSPGAERMVAY